MLENISDCFQCFNVTLKCNVFQVFRQYEFVPCDDLGLHLRYVFVHNCVQNKNVTPYELALY